MTTPTITVDQAQAVVDTLTAPRITKESIEARIGDVSYLIHGTLTICVITMRNGFKVLGKAAPASPENYRSDVGERYAYEDAFKQIWALEGYRLCEALRPTPTQL